jgi:hypothetical protein
MDKTLDSSIPWAPEAPPAPEVPEAPPVSSDVFSTPVTSKMVSSSSSSKKKKQHQSTGVFDFSLLASFLPFCFGPMSSFATISFNFLCCIVASKLTVFTRNLPSTGDNSLTAQIKMSAKIKLRATGQPKYFLLLL